MVILNLCLLALSIAALCACELFRAAGLRDAIDAVKAARRGAR